jgi:hypothetical protein
VFVGSTSGVDAPNPAMQGTVTSGASLACSCLMANVGRHKRDDFMATTNWTTAEAFQANCPHTFNALQHLVMAMADFAKSRGKKSFFGRDKGLAAYKKFEEKFKDTLLAMVLDGVVERNAAPSRVRTELIKAIELFAATFPNWQEAYSFSNEFLVDSAAVAEDRIQSAMR